MAQNQNNSSSFPPEVQQAMQFLSGQMPPAAQPSSPQEPQNPYNSTMFVQTGIGSMPMQMPNTPLSMDDFVKLRSYEGSGNGGPYAATPQGEAQTSRQFRSMYESPYMSPLAQAIGRNHPRLGSMIDNAMLTGSLVKPAVDASGNPIAVGAGYGISSVLSAMRAAPEARLAYRQQLEQAPIAYETSQAQLAQERAMALQREAEAVRFLGQNKSQEESQMNRGLAGANVRAQQAQYETDRKTALGILQNFTRNQTALHVADIKANAQMKAALIRAKAAANKPASLADLNGLNRDALAAVNKEFPTQAAPDPSKFFAGTKDPEYQKALTNWNSRQARMNDIQQWYNRMRKIPAAQVVDYHTYSLDRTPYGGTNAPAQPKPAAVQPSPDNPLGISR